MSFSGDVAKFAKNAKADVDKKVRAKAAYDKFTAHCRAPQGTKWAVVAFEDGPYYGKPTP